MRDKALRQEPGWGLQGPVWLECGVQLYKLMIKDSTRNILVVLWLLFSLYRNI